MPDPDLDFGNLFDEVHVIGRTHLDILADAATALCHRIADATSQEDLFACTHHLLAVSQAMLSWVQYLCPKGDGEDGEEERDEDEE